MSDLHVDATPATRSATRMQVRRAAEVADVTAAFDAILAAANRAPAPEPMRRTALTPVVSASRPASSPPVSFVDEPRRSSADIERSPSTKSPDATNKTHEESPAPLANVAPARSVLRASFVSHADIPGREARPINAAPADTAARPTAAIGARPSARPDRQVAKRQAVKRQTAAPEPVTNDAAESKSRDATTPPAPAAHQRPAPLDATLQQAQLAPKSKFQANAAIGHAAEVVARAGAARENEKPPITRSARTTNPPAPSAPRTEPLAVGPALAPRTNEAKTHVPTPKAPPATPPTAQPAKRPTEPVSPKPVVRLDEALAARHGHEPTPERAVQPTRTATAEPRPSAQRRRIAAKEDAPASPTTAKRDAPVESERPTQKPTIEHPIDEKPTTTAVESPRAARTNASSAALPLATRENAFRASTQAPASARRTREELPEVEPRNGRDAVPKTIARGSLPSAQESAPVAPVTTTRGIADAAPPSSSATNVATHVELGDGALVAQPTNITVNRPEGEPTAAAPAVGAVKARTVVASRGDVVSTQQAQAPQHSRGQQDVDRVRLVQRVAKALQSAAERGAPLRVRLTPPELGAVRLEIAVRDGAMTARLEAESPAARAVILENLHALRGRLAALDVKIERLDVDLMQQPGSEQRERQSFADSQAYGERREAPSPSPANRGAGGKKAAAINTVAAALTGRVSGAINVVV